MPESVVPLPKPAVIGKKQCIPKSALINTRHTLFMLFFEGGKNMKQLKITLACAGGMSSSMLCSKIIAAAATKGYECECKAYSTSGLANVIEGSSVLLIGPQVAYQAAKLKETYPDVPVEVISMQDYGRMNGEKIFNDLLAKYEL